MSSKSEADQMGRPLRRKWAGSNWVSAGLKLQTFERIVNFLELAGKLIDVLPAD